MIRWLRSFFAWETRPVLGCWIYQENTVTGKRRVWLVDGAGHMPLDLAWLHAGNGEPDIHGCPASRSPFARYA